MKLIIRSLLLSAMQFINAEIPIGINDTLLAMAGSYDEAVAGGYWQFGFIPILNRKIFRGRRVPIREHPYIASVRRKVAHYTTAAILTRKTFVTTAYPLIDVDISELNVVVGENYNDRGSALLTVLVVIVHEMFDVYTMAGDLALLRVYEEISYGGAIKPITFFKGPLMNGNIAFVSGWGRCDHTGNELCLPRSSKYNKGEILDPMLRTVTFTMWPSNYCEVYKRNDVEILPGMLCLGVAREADPVGDCMAVPGAPLVIDGHLAGLLSWGYGCGYPYDLPLIYTSIHFYQPWLAMNIDLLESIARANLTDLFRITRASILINWFKLTRVWLPDQHIIPDEEEMNDLPIDRVLSRLNGTIYDIRDYIYNGHYHEYKLYMYKELRRRNTRTVALINVQTNATTTYPFIHYNSSYVGQRVNESNEDTLEDINSCETED